MKFSALTLGRLFEIHTEIGERKTRAEVMEWLNVTGPQLSRGIQVVKLPSEILDLFSSPSELTDYYARKLLALIKREGLPTIIARARSHAAISNDRRAAVVIAALQACPPKARLGAGKIPTNMSHTIKRQVTLQSNNENRKRLPLDIAKDFKAGQARGEWRTITDGAKGLKLPRTTVSRAMSIDKLPDEVKRLFMGDTLTPAVGARLISIQNEIGMLQLKMNARDTERCSAIRPARTVLHELELSRGTSREKVKIHVRPGYQNKFLKIECSHMIVALLYRKEIEVAIRQIIKRRRDKRDVTDLFSKEELARLESNFSKAQVHKMKSSLLKSEG